MIANVRYYLYPLIAFIISGVMLCGCAESSSTEEAWTPQNVVLILTDDQGAHLSALGTPGIQTPHVDRLAENGMLFTNAFAAVPSCSPSRSSINTGMYPHANGHWRNTITPKLSDPDEAFGHQATRVDQVGIHEHIPTLPEILDEAGFYTAITQKFHMSPPWKFPFTARDPVHNDPARYREEIAEFISAAGDRPFYFQANISPPHRPFRQHLDKFPEFSVSPDSIEVPADLPDTPELRADLAEYFGCVQLADACVGAIVEALAATGKLDNTLIIFTGDQGQAYHRAKASAYYAGLHVPLVVSGPPVAATGSRSNALVSLIDLMPTVLDFLNLDVPATVQGRSFLGLLRGETASNDRSYVFGEHNSHGPARAEHYPTRMVFDGRFYYLQNLLPDKGYLLPGDLREEKVWGNAAYTATLKSEKDHPVPYRLLLQLENGRPPTELYDIRQDPYQLNNLSGQPAFAEQEKELAGVLADWRIRTNDTINDPLLIPTRLSIAD